MRKIIITTLAIATLAVAGRMVATMPQTTTTTNKPAAVAATEDLSAHCAQIKKQNPARQNVQAHRTPAGVLVTTYTLGEGVDVERVGF